MIISTATQWLNTNTKHGEQKQDPELAQWEVLCGGCYGQRRHKLSHKARLGLGGPEHVRLPDKTWHRRRLIFHCPADARLWHSSHHHIQIHTRLQTHITNKQTNKTPPKKTETVKTSLCTKGIKTHKYTQKHSDFLPPPRSWFIFCEPWVRDDSLIMPIENNCFLRLLSNINDYPLLPICRILLVQCWRSCY